MVFASLTIGAVVGILLSGGFVYWEIGRFAEPQVPVTRFDERREVFAYTAGLFVGVPIAVAYVLFLLELQIGSLPGTIAFLAAIVAGTEISQRLLLRSRYWSGPAGPFYALGFRAAIGGIVALAIVGTYLGGLSIDGTGILRVVVSAVAVLLLQVAGALLSLPTDPVSGQARGVPWAGAGIGAVGFFMLGLGTVAGEPTAIVAAAVIGVGAATIYLRLRPWLEAIPPPQGGTPPPAPAIASAYGRTPVEPPPSPPEP